MTGQTVPLAKLSHASTDLSSRQTKAVRIEQVLQAFGIDIADADVLDIGTGSGMIASYCAARSHSLVSVDVVDERTDFDFPFVLLESERLPFDAGSFDAIISNHVIEHVDNPALHLAEIARVLRPGGVCYLATPNRLWPMEPHFKLPLLAWLPSASLRDAYVRKTRRGTRYDAALLTPSALSRLVADAGLREEDASFELTSLIVKSKLGCGITAARPVWKYARNCAPSLVTILRRRD